ncbi:hypothetical protein GCM10027610_051010 [Dactylosporangium cerinum]
MLSYGQFYGPGTYHERDVPAPPRIQIDRAADRTVALLDAPSGSSSSPTDRGDEKRGDADICGPRAPYAGVMSTIRDAVERVPRPTVFVLFGATGDLAKRMVLPAFATLAAEGLLPKEWVLIGNGRGDIPHEDFRDHVHKALSEFGPRPKKRWWRDFEPRLLFAGGGFGADDPGSLLDVIEQARSRTGDDPQLVHYLAVPPVAFGGLTEALGRHGLVDDARVVYEKPFGTSPQTFRTLNRTVRRVLDESQVYRIDHFLGKEATQDLHVLRFANEVFSAMWDRDHIESVQIDVPETLGVDDRAGFYDATGSVLDMLVTHLFQVAAEVAMETPASSAPPTCRRRGRR